MPAGAGLWRIPDLADKEGPPIRAPGRTG